MPELFSSLAPETVKESQRAILTHWPLQSVSCAVVLALICCEITAVVHTRLCKSLSGVGKQTIVRDFVCTKDIQPHLRRALDARTG